MDGTIILQQLHVKNTSLRNITPSSILFSVVTNYTTYFFTIREIKSLMLRFLICPKELRLIPQKYLLYQLQSLTKQNIEKECEGVLWNDEMQYYEKICDVMLREGMLCVRRGYVLY